MHSDSDHVAMRGRMCPGRRTMSQIVLTGMLSGPLSARVRAGRLVTGRNRRLSSTVGSRRDVPASRLSGCPTAAVASIQIAMNPQVGSFSGPSACSMHHANLNPRDRRSRGLGIAPRTVALKGRTAASPQWNRPTRITDPMLHSHARRTGPVAAAAARDGPPAPVEHGLLHLYGSDVDSPPPISAAKFPLCQHEAGQAGR